MIDDKAFGRRIRAARKAAGFSSAEALARAFDPPLSGMTVHRWEAGMHKPDLDRLYDLADILGVKPSELLEEEVAA